MGITQKTYEKWVGHPVTAKDIENLTIEDVKPIYKAWYWDVRHYFMHIIAPKYQKKMINSLNSFGRAVPNCAHIFI